MVAAPPPSRTSLSPAASNARSSAASMPSVTKWNVVPPSIGIGARGRWVSTNTGWWYGGSSPHQPLHCSSPHSPRMGPNMLRPMIVAPTPTSPWGANRSSMPSSGPSVAPAPSSSNCRQKVGVANAHLCSPSPPTPSGWSGPWSGAAA